ncbi:MAG: hypothetical protein AVDCRST_MAG87-3408 [uncultured Thermomicrobiales bacterium]|uniref:Uncharacterized protein n=1 Tax=uncultured Thermomicrobiales bacterium TaxID=1645740 RepID=A0A6J4VLE7_9BACT|nr:MAG: hypothetical protein AVDCRST_MAG87-3408 [uncultured Thermomicrobiales bacterium]
MMGLMGIVAVVGVVASTRRRPVDR